MKSEPSTSINRKSGGSETETLGRGAPVRSNWNRLAHSSFRGPTSTPCSVRHLVSGCLRESDTVRLAGRVAKRYAASGAASMRWGIATGWYLGTSIWTAPFTSTARKANSPPAKSPIWPISRVASIGTSSGTGNVWAMSLTGSGVNRSTRIVVWSSTVRRRKTRNRRVAP